ncbi:MAG: polysaccharide deacetylase family protein [Prevotella sp.]|nr:polysaccharide deacetylase family protein [Prevotella sp.]
MKKIVCILLLLLAIGLLIWWRMPLIGSEWSKQTIFVGLLDAWYGASRDDKAYALWIDDDSTKGIFDVKTIADEVGIMPVFAVIADKMEPEVADSLAKWQNQGAGIVLHGLRHERWKDWNERQIKDDILQSYHRLSAQGFDTTKIMKMIIPPHGCNTRTIRKVISQHGCSMISGACLINPDRHVFQLGRIGITRDTDLVAMRELLQEALGRNSFVIFGTHSSIPESFSREKIKEVLMMAKDLGFSFDIQK